MQINPTILLYALVIELLLRSTSSRPCGIVNIIKGPQTLDKSTFVNARENFSDQYNGRTLTIYGWVMFSKGSDGIQPLLEVRIIPNADEKKEDVPVTFNPLATIFYQNIDKTPEVVIKVAETAKDYRSVTVPTKFFEERWIFFAYSADYSVDSVVVYLSDYTDLEMSKEVKVSFKELSLRQKLAINIGCAPEDSATPNTTTQCMDGKIQNFDYILDYFKNPSFLYLFATGQNNNIVFLLDNYSGAADNYMSKDGSKMPYKILKQGNVQLDNSKETSARTPVNDLAIRKESSVMIPTVLKLDPTKFIESPTIYVKFNYTEPLTDDFLFFYLRDANGQINFEMHLKKQGDKRFAEVSMNDQDLFVSIPAIFAPNTENSLSLSIIRRIDKVGLMLYTNMGTVFSSFIRTDLSKSYDLIFFDSTAVFDGSIQIAQVNILETASGAVFNEFKDKYSRRNLECASNCQYYASLDINKRSCLDCGLDSVLLPKSSTCANVCPVLSKNFFGACGNCQTDKCAEVGVGYFVAEKLSNYKVQVSQKKDIAAFNNDYANKFAVTIPDALLGQNYNYTLDVLAASKTATYTFVPLNGYELENKIVVIGLKDDANLSDRSKSLIQNAGTFSIPLGAGLLGPVTPNQPLIVNPTTNPRTDTGPSAPTTNFREEKRNEGVEHSFRIMGIFGCIALWITVGVGLIGLLFVSASVNRPKFLYQKFLQSFLMFQFIAFWVFYNSYLPRNLLSYLHALFEFTTGWHDIFNKAAKDNHGGSSEFDDNFFKNVHRRFFEEGVLTHFVLTFGFVLLIQAIMLFIYMLIKAASIAMLKRKTTQPVKTTSQHKRDPAFADNYLVSAPSSSETQPFMKSMILTFVYEFEWMILITVCLMFTVEVTLFAVYNYYGASFSHSLFTFSFIWAIIWGIITLALIAYVLVYPFKTNIDLLKTENYKKNGFIYEGLTLQGIRKNFQGIQYLFYLGFSITMVVAYNSRLTQAIVTYSLFIIFVAYIVALLPPSTKFDKFEQIGVHALLLIAFTFLFMLVLDDSAKLMDPMDRWIIGYFAAIISFLVIFWNMCVIIWKVLTYLLEFIKLRRASVGLMKPDIDILDDIEEEQIMLDNKNAVVKPSKEKNLATGVDTLLGGTRSLKNDDFFKRSNNDIDDHDRTGAVDPKISNPRFVSTNNLIFNSDTSNSQFVQDRGNSDPHINQKVRSIEQSDIIDGKRIGFDKNKIEAKKGSSNLKQDHVDRKAPNVGDLSIDIKAATNLKKPNDGPISFRGTDVASNQKPIKHNHVVEKNQRAPDFGMTSDYNQSTVNKHTPTILSRDGRGPHTHHSESDSGLFRDERFIESKLQNLSKLDSLRKAQAYKDSLLKADSDISVPKDRFSKMADIKKLGDADLDKASEEVKKKLNLNYNKNGKNVAKDPIDEIVLDDRSYDKEAYAYFREESDLKNNYRG